MKTITSGELMIEMFLSLLLGMCGGWFIATMPVRQWTLDCMNEKGNFIKGTLVESI